MSQSLTLPSIYCDKIRNGLFTTGGGGGGVGREAAAEAATDGEVKSEDSEEKKEESCRDEDNVEVEATSGRGGRGGAGPARALELGEGRNSSS